MRRVLVLAVMAFAAGLVGCGNPDHRVGDNGSPDVGLGPDAVDAGSDAGDAGCANPCDCCSGDEVCFENRCCRPNCDGKDCGSDGCGGSCGDCAEGWTCNLAQGTCECTSESDEAFCRRLSTPCGTASGMDDCGRDRTVECDLCVAPETCNHAARACECVPETVEQLCARVGKCGPIVADDTCGTSRSVDCGGCPAGELCGAASQTCELCTPLEDEAFCDARQQACGTLTAQDECSQQSRTADCGGCDPGFDCDAAGQCVTCPAETDDAFCQRLGTTCGSVTAQDSCRLPRTVTCGSCPAPQFCDATNHCHACIPETDAQFCARESTSCGDLIAPDNCGDPRFVAECGPCAPGDRCSQGSCALCVPETDAQLCAAWFKNCGSPTLTDVCGTSRTPADCGTCGSGQNCLANGVCGTWGQATNDGCASPERLVFDALGQNASAVGSSVGAGPDAMGSCGGSGNDVVYAFVLTATRHVAIGVTAGSAAQYLVYLRSSCDQASTELGCASAPAAAAPTGLSLRTLPAGTYYLWVDLVSGTAGDFTVTVDARMPHLPPANDSCASPTALSFTGTTASVAGDTYDAAPDASGTCGTLTGMDVVYSFTLAAPSAIVATLTRDPGEPGFQPALYLRSTCASAAAADEVACAVATGDTASAVVPQLAAGTYYLFVDGDAGSVGRYSLQVEISPVVTNDQCAGVIDVPIDAVTRNGSVSGDTTASLDDASGTCGLAPGGRDVVYSFIVPVGPPQDAQVELTPASGASSWWPVLFVRTSCDQPGSELSCVAGSTLAPQASMSLTRLPAGTYFVWVDGGLAGTGGSFTLSIGLSDPAPAPANDDCRTPTLLTLGAAGAVNAIGTTVAASNDSQGSCSLGATLHTGGDVVYAIDLPAAEILSVRVARLAGSAFRPAVYVRSACGDPLSEITCAVASAATGVASAQRTNVAAGTYYVIVDGLNGEADAFSLDILTYDAMNNDTCATARALSFDAAGHAHARTDTCAATDGGEAGNCWQYPYGPWLSSALGKDVVYTFTLAVASDVTAVLSPNFWGTSLLQVRTTCTDFATEATCHAQDASLSATNTLQARNLAAGTYYLWVDSDAAANCGIADLLVTATAAAPLAANDTCAGAAAVTLDPLTGTGTVHATTFDGTNDTDGSCATRSGPDLFYSVTLTQRSGLEVTLTPSAGSPLRPALYLRKACADSSTEVACRYANTATPVKLTIPQLYAGTYYVGVDSWGLNLFPGAFDLEVKLVTPPPPPPNDLCSGATPLAFDPVTNKATATGNTGDGFDDYVNYCAFRTTYPTFTNGPDLVYSFTLSADAAVTATVTRDPANTSYFPEVSIRSSCAATDEVACATVPMSNTTGSSTVTVPLPVGTYYVFVDGIKTTVDGSDFGPFTLEVTQAPAAAVAGDGCANPLPLSFGADGIATASGTTATATQSGGLSTGPDLVYVFTLTTEQTVKVTLGAATGSTFKPYAYLRKTCGDLLSQLGSAYASTGNAIFTLNRVAPGTYYLWVDTNGTNPSWAGAYNLTVELTTPTTAAPANDTCAGAQPIVLDPVSHGAHVTGDTTWATNDYGTSCAMMYYESSPDLVYSITLPQPTTLYAMLAKDPADPSTLRAMLTLRSTCASEARADEVACFTVAYPSGSLVQPLAQGTYYLIAEFQRNATGRFYLDVVTRDTAPANDTCATAEPIVLDANGSAMLAGNTRGMTNSERGTCYNSAGPDVVYSLTLSSPKNLVLDLTPGTLLPALFVRAADCSSGAEVGCVSNISALPAQLALQKLAAGTYFVWVDTATAAATAPNPFALRITATDPPPAPPEDTCAGAVPLTFDAVTGIATASGDTLAGNNDYSGTCATLAAPLDGPDLVYSFTLSAPASVSAKVARGTRATYNPAVYLRSSCTSAAPADELACASGTSATVTAAQSLPAGTYYVIVDGQKGSFGDFTLTVTQTTTTRVAGDSCLDAVPLSFTAGVASFSGTTVNAGNSGDGSCRTNSTGDVVYSFTVTDPESQVDILLTPSTGSALRGTLYVRSDCADRSAPNQLVCQTTTAANTPVSARLPRLPAGTYFLWVDTYSTYAGAFTGTVTAQPSPAVPLDDVCAGATPLVFDGTGKATVTGAETWFALDSGSGACALGSGPDRVFSMTLGAASKVTAKVTRDTTTPTYQPMVYIRSVCDQSSATAELACARAFSGVATAVVNTLPAGTYWVWVDGTQTAATDTPGKFTLEVTQATAVAGPANETCANASPITFVNNTATINGDTTLAQDDSSNQCGVVAAPDLVYSFTLTAPQQVTASIVGGTGFSPALEVRRSCGSILNGNILQCRPYSASGTSITLPVLDAGTYYLWVDSTTSGSKGTFALTVTLDVPPATRPANDTCAGAIALTQGVIVSGDTTNAVNDYLDTPYSPACVVMSGGYYPKAPEVVYSYTPSTSGPFSVLVNPSATYDAMVVVTEGTCGLGTACVAMVDLGSAGDPEKATVNGTAGVTYYILVDNSSANGSTTSRTGTFTIVVR